VSRGPGKWQRAVIDACERSPGEWVSVDEVVACTLGQQLGVRGRGNAYHHTLSVDEGAARALAQHITPAVREAARRAIRTLAASGRVEVDTVKKLTARPPWNGHQLRPRERWVLAARVQHDRGGA
jgi:hypothetical protein